MDSFWRRVQRGRSDECWPWHRPYSGDGGYGRLRVAGRLHRAHRLAYELAIGPIPAGAQVLHTCDNPSCCNPAHLFLGDPRVNARDRAAKGRGGWLGGAANGRAKLQPAQVTEIRARYAAGGMSQQSLADEFGVGQTQIGRLVRGEEYV